MRIVAGEFKGRRLAGPESKSTRPTSDKVREALFSILGPIDGWTVLDLFAGTGAVGIEAASRGAEAVVLVERDKRTIEIAHRNIAATSGLESGRVKDMKVDVFRFLDEYRDENFDLVFVDPPYAEAESLAGKLTAMLPPVLKPGATVVTESDRRSPLELASPFTLRSEHRYGDTLIRIFDAP